MEKTLRSLALSRADKFPTDRFGIELLPGTFPDQGSPLSWWIRPWNARRSGLCCVDPEFSFLPHHLPTPTRGEAEPNACASWFRAQTPTQHQAQAEAPRKRRGNSIGETEPTGEANPKRPEPGREAET